MNRQTQFSVTVPNTPGMLSRMTKLLSDAGINIDGLSTEDRDGSADIRFTLDQPEKAAPLLRGAGYHFLDIQVFRLGLPDRPWGLRALAHELAKEGVNILSLRGAAQGLSAELVIAVDRPDKAAPVIARWEERQSDD